MRKGIIILWVGILFLAIIMLFWQNQLVYSLPTPIPENYKKVAIGETIAIKQKLDLKKRPVFLHFFNPDCPCSRFNIPHFKSLVKQYGNKVSFVIVPKTKKPYSAEEIRNKFGLDIPVMFDDDIVATCGVYSTPQAVIITTDYKLHYRGNYNKSRYCTDKKSNYAEIALNSLLDKKSNVLYNQLALKAYGCELPNCTKTE